MNKYQRAKSKKIKKLVRWYRPFGYKITYKEAKRINRKVDTITARIQSMPTRWAGAAMIHEHRDHCDGLSVGFIAIDESTPIEETPALWSKVNPHLAFETRHLGKWNFKEET